MKEKYWACCEKCASFQRELPDTDWICVGCGTFNEHPYSECNHLNHTIAYGDHTIPTITCTECKEKIYVGFWGSPWSQIGEIIKDYIIPELNMLRERIEKLEEQKV